MVCGSELVYSQQSKKAECYYCGQEILTNTLCEKGHFVCDQCHAEDAISIIKKMCLNSDERDMLTLMQQIRSHPTFPMHGPEHHAMVPAISPFPPTARPSPEGDPTNDQRVTQGFPGGFSGPNIGRDLAPGGYIANSPGQLC